MTRPNKNRYDDGSYGPVLLRLAWHSSGTYNKEDGTGGSNGGTMRFRAEASHSANNGLEIARNLLESKIKPKYPDISYGDLYTLGGVVAVQELVSSQTCFYAVCQHMFSHREALQSNGAQVVKI